MTVLVTGCAGFIGYHVADRLLTGGDRVVGVDNLNDYYDVRLKRGRLALLEGRPGFTFAELDVADRDAMRCLAATWPDVTRVVHLAAQAGVRHSMVDPDAYVRSNVQGQLQLLEFARHQPRFDHLVYASSSSVYGANEVLPFTETDRVDTPLSLYAATKRSGELMGHAYGHLYGIPQTGLRFFTVYGPWGRPDMAYFLFAEAIMAGAPLTLYDRGRLRRDFTYIDDIVSGVVACLASPPSSSPPVRVLNIGNHASEEVATLVSLLEEALGRKAVLRFAERPAADVGETFADVSSLAALTGFAPSTSLQQGVPLFADWFLRWRRTRASVCVLSERG